MLWSIKRTKSKQTSQQVKRSVSQPASIQECEYTADGKIEAQFFVFSPRLPARDCMS